MPRTSRNQRVWWAYDDPRWDRSPKARRTAERQEKILELVADGRVPSYRKMAKTLEGHGFYVTHVTVKNDYAALGLVSDEIPPPKTPPPLFSPMTTTTAWPTQTFP